MRFILIGGVTSYTEEASRDLVVMRTFMAR